MQCACSVAVGSYSLRKSFHHLQHLPLGGGGEEEGGEEVEGMKAAVSVGQQTGSLLTHISGEMFWRVSPVSVKVGFPSRKKNEQDCSDFVIHPVLCKHRALIPETGIIPHSSSTATCKA